MSVIRYFSSKAAVATIKNRRLRLSQVSSFNDPFEYSMIYMTEDGGEYPHDWLRAPIDERIRILCACDESLKTNGDVLMWSHYGDKHKGFRVHLQKQFLESKAEVSWPVDYESRIQIVDPDYIPEFGDVRALEAFEPLSKALRAKGKMWSHEKEFRFFFKKDDCRFDARKGFHYLPFPARVVTRVDFGLLTSEWAKRRMQGLLSCREFAHVEFHKAIKVRGKFSIAYERYA